MHPYIYTAVDVYVHSILTQYLFHFHCWSEIESTKKPVWECIEERSR